MGAWAVERATQAPLEAGLVLGAIGAAKLLAAAIPPAVIYDQLPWHRFWRALSWIGGILLTIYGAANTVTRCGAGGSHPSGRRLRRRRNGWPRLALGSSVSRVGCSVVPGPLVLPQGAKCLP
ncbi:hypothetical protein QNO00_00780 [Arthrobacter sp. zg-Y1219]|nr:hypothetical protein [Arthrobacter sp. zg-Y1219]MDK1358802.1 hypothetical protein [Arthrobacter sp. zg-Y1219]